MKYYLGEIWVTIKGNFFTSKFTHKMTTVLIQAESVAEADIKMKQYTDDREKRSQIKNSTFEYFVTPAI